MSSFAHSKTISIDLDKPLVRVNVGGVMASNDKQADQYSVSITRSGENVPLTGCSAHGYMILPNGETIKITGTVSGNTASVIIPQSGYAYDGAFTLAIKVSGTDYNATVAIFDGHIVQTVTETIVDGDRVLYGVDEILALINDMEEAEEAASTAATNANDKATAAQTAADNATEKAAAAQEAASNANTKAAAANTAASAANTAAAKINGLTVAATGLDAGATPTAAISEVDGHKHIAFGLPKGAKGDTGSTGATPALSIGTVTTGAPGTQASASFTGTAAAPVLNLTIPRGDAGSGSVSTVDSVQPDGGNVPLGAVRYNTAQSLSDAQKQQARENIGAGTGQGTVKTVDGESPYVEGDVHINAVRYSAQTLTAAQQTLARGNIGAASSANYTATLSTGGWSASAPYTQTVSVTGLLATDGPIVDVSLSGVDDSEAASALLEAWGFVGRITAGAGSITAYCYTEKPEVAIPLILKVVR